LIFFLPLAPFIVPGKHVIWPFFAMF
jgi:hypothetical protein